MAVIVGFRMIGVKNSSSILERWRLSLALELMALKFRLLYWRDEGVYLFVAYLSSSDGVYVSLAKFFLFTSENLHIYLAHQLCVTIMILCVRMRYPAEQQRLRVSDQNALSVYWLWLLLYGCWWRNI